MDPLISDELFEAALAACQQHELPEFFLRAGVESAVQDRIVERLNAPPHSFDIFWGSSAANAKSRPQRLSAEQRGQFISTLRDSRPTSPPLDTLSFHLEALLELSLAECIGASGAMARIATDAPFLASLKSLTALDLSCSLREARRANADATAFRTGLCAILEAMPPTLTTLTLPESIGDFCHDGYGEELGGTFGRMKGTISTLTVCRAVQGSSVVPSFVQALNHQWLPSLPGLTKLSLLECALHSAETLFHVKAGPSGMRGGGFGPQSSCQFADLAAAAPNLTDLDLSGNILRRVVDGDHPDLDDPACTLTKDPPSGMKTLAAMLRALPELKRVRHRALHTAAQR